MWKDIVVINNVYIVVVNNNRVGEKKMVNKKDIQKIEELYRIFEQEQQNKYVIGIWTWKRIAILEAITLIAIFIVVMVNGYYNGELFFSPFR